MSKKKYQEVENTERVVCPRCGVLAEAREHIAIGDKQLAQPFYFSRWFNCLNGVCPTTVFMSDEFKVWNENAAAKNFQIARDTVEEFGEFKDELQERLRGMGL